MQSDSPKTGPKEPSDFLRLAGEEWQKLQLSPHGTMEEIAQMRRQIDAFRERLSEASNEPAHAEEYDALRELRRSIAIFDRDGLSVREREIWQSRLDEAPAAMRQAIGLSAPTDPTAEHFTVHYGNHRTAAVLVLYNTGRIDPDVVVGEQISAKGKIPLTAGRLAELYHEGILHTSNADYKGKPWINFHKADEILKEFDVQKFFDPRRDQGVGISLRAVPAERSGALYRQITNHDSEPFPHYLMRNINEFRASQVATATDKPESAASRPPAEDDSPLDKFSKYGERPDGNKWKDVLGARNSRNLGG